MRPISPTLLLRASLAATLVAGIVACESPPLSDEGPMPELSGATAWLNSAPLTRDSLRGKVTLIDFWTYSCINCLRVLPHVKAWEAKYRSQGFVVIGIHTPEFDFEDDSANVRAAMNRFEITYPVAMDNNMDVWNAFNNKAWPAHYFVDAEGRIRYHHYGEGDYDRSERVIQALLLEARERFPDMEPARSKASTPIPIIPESLAADFKNIRSPETYIGYARTKNFASSISMQRDTAAIYQFKDTLTLNEWGMQGSWVFTREYAEVRDAGSIRYRFHARDLNLVLSMGASQTPIRFHVTIDGKPPGINAGADVDRNGRGVIDSDRMYHLIRQSEKITDHVFTITFETPGARAYAFSFG